MKNKNNLNIVTKNNNNYCNTSIIINPKSLQMDPKIWSKLPPEILEFILSFLPLKTFMSLRSTCKAKTKRKIQYPNFNLHIEHLTFVTTPKGDNPHQQGVYFKGCLYFATPEPFSVVYFDFENGKWEKSIVGLPNQLTFVRLVSVNDDDGFEGKKLFLIGGVGNNGISRSIKLWEMSGEGNWVEIQSLPDLMCKKFVSWINLQRVSRSKLHFVAYGKSQSIDIRMKKLLVVIN
ncbi:hypothetical protein TSUD_05570 [Trifolium subterraneum]|uniref:F-box domain-containing protein n=1 Tax=Trifolium subterraneum TaxID=3900 RepID=A0A2Z6M5I9_TRISU|nr:hypothetical protein TSUD_05570 [Trifolium subterraneum]